MRSPDTFQAGDVVQLKSGGPSMTVLERDDSGKNDESYRCVWFDATGKDRTARFPLAVLKLADPS